MGFSLQISDLDNPFGYYGRYSGADVSLKPLENTARRLSQIASVEASRLKESAGTTTDATTPHRKNRD
jgi:hypothetical protein